MGKFADRKPRKFYTHSIPPTWREVPLDDRDGIDAARYGYLFVGSDSRAARGARVLIQQDPNDPYNINRDGTAKSKEGIPAAYAYKTDNELVLAMRDIQGQPYWFTPYCTFAQTKESRSLGLTCDRCNENVQDVVGLMSDVDWHNHSVASLRFKSAEEVWNYLQGRITELGWPMMNHAHLTGRGLLCGYRFEPVPFYDREYDSGTIKRNARGKMLMRCGHKWRQMAIYIYATLIREVSDDDTSLTPHHYYKVAGALNMKSGTQARVIREPEGQLYTFSMLYNFFAPLIRAAFLRGDLDAFASKAHDCWPAGWITERKARRPASVRSNITSLDAHRALKTGKSAKAHRVPRKDGKIADPNACGAAIWARTLPGFVRFMEVLAAEGNFNGARRQALLFLIANGLAWVDPENWCGVFLDTVRPYCDFSERETVKRVGTIIKRVGEALEGSKRFHNDMEEDPRFRFQSSTIRSNKWLNLRDSDFETYPFLSAIAPPAIMAKLKADRRAEANVVKGRADRPTGTSRNRAAYAVAERADIAENIRKAHELRQADLSFVAIGTAMGVSKTMARNYCKMPTPDIEAARQVLADADARIAEARTAAQKGTPANLAVNMPRATAAEPAKVARLADADARNQATWLFIRDRCTIAQIATALHRPHSVIAGWLNTPEILSLKVSLAA